MIVVDACVAVKWFVPEPGEEQAKILLTKNAPLLAPSVFRLEVTSVLQRSYREGKLSLEDAQDGCSGLERILKEGLIQLIPNEELWDMALALSFKAKHAFVDCLYLSAAKTMEATVVTTDSNMVTRGQKVGVKARELGEAP